MLDSANSYIIRGNKKLDNGDIDDAIKDYSEAIRLNPEYAEAYYCRGRAHNNNGNINDSLNDYNKCIDLKPGFAPAYNNRGFIRINKGAYSEALKDFDHAIMLDPNNWNAHNNRGCVQIKLGNLDMAILDFDETIRLNPNHAETYNNRGIAKKKKGNIPEALQDFNRSIELKPDLEEAYDNRRGIYITDNHVEHGPKDLDIVKQVCEYFRVLDQSIDSLSIHKEGYLCNLPAWAQSTRRIMIGYTNNKEIVAVKATQDNNLENDEIVIIKIENESDLNRISAPASIKWNLKTIKRESQILWPDLVLVSAGNPLAEPIVVDSSLMFTGGDIGFLAYFNEVSAKEDAMNMWNACLCSQNTLPKSYVFHVSNILSKLESLIKRKAFVERRIHRFINKHSQLLLPTHVNCYYEHDFYLNENKRIADFVLENEQGRPALLIELESTVHKVFTKNMDLTAKANHGVGQIAEWVYFIDEDAKTNASNDFKFLTGPKERLVIIGRGLEYRSKLVDTKHRDTLVWTYDLFIEEAKNRLNNSYAAQCNLLGMRATKPF